MSLATASSTLPSSLDESEGIISLGASHSASTPSSHSAQKAVHKRALANVFLNNKLGGRRQYHQEEALKAKEDLDIAISQCIYLQLQLQAFLRIQRGVDYTLFYF